MTRIVALALAAFAASAQAQTDTAATPPPPSPLFASDTVITFKLRANFRALGRMTQQRSAERAMVLSYNDGAQEREIAGRVRTRGHWRLAHCDNPPLRVSFGAQATRGTLFEGIRRGRLVVPCRNFGDYEQYILREFQLYRAYQLLSPFAHRARLARVTYVDSASGRELRTSYAFLLEDDAAMARRNGGRLLETRGARAGDLDSRQDAIVGVFQYMIGNTDWSVAGLHNVLLVSANERVYATIYDFDHSGAVEATYARPPEQLRLPNVRTRLMRGYCASPEEFEAVFALFREKKDAIYALYDDHIGRLMNRDDARDAKSYFDDFYATINDPGRARDRIVRACRPYQ